MFLLTAEFEVNLNDYLIAKCPKDEPPNFATSLDGFDVEIALISGLGSAKKSKNERYFKRCFNYIKISVTRYEDEAPPKPIERDGTRDFTTQTEYFESRRPEYTGTAITLLNRFLNFFKYQLAQPISSNRGDWSIGNPSWKDKDGKKAGNGIDGWTALAPPGIGPTDFGLKAYEGKHKAKLLKGLKKSKLPLLDAEILADAQIAAYGGNYRRAVLEMAIACEIAIKSRFFGSTVSTASVFEYLENDRKINTKPIELIHKVSKHTFGRSFKDEQSNHYENIEYLFRCQNKIAHRGKLIFRDGNGTENQLTKEKLEEWWGSVQLLRTWMKNLK